VIFLPALSHFFKHLTTKMGKVTLSNFSYPKLSELKIRISQPRLAHNLPTEGALAKLCNRVCYPYLK
jgi:hypothetical protein